MAELDLPIVEPSRFQVEVDEAHDGAATFQLTGLSKPAWLHRGYGFLAGLAGCMLIVVLASVAFPSPSHTQSPSVSALAYFNPAMPATRGTQIGVTSLDQTPEIQMSSPMERSAQFLTVPVRNTPPAMQTSYSALDPLDLEPRKESQRAEAATAYAVPSSRINRMQPGQNIVNADSGVNVTSLGWLSIIALGAASAFMAGKAVKKAVVPLRSSTVMMQYYGDQQQGYGGQQQMGGQQGYGQQQMGGQQQQGTSAGAIANPNAWYIFPRDGASGIISTDYQVFAGQSQTLGAYDLMDPKTGKMAGGTMASVLAEQCSVQVAPDSSCVYLYALGAQPTGWRSRPDEPWNWLYPGQSQALSHHWKISLDCNDPENAVFKLAAGAQANETGPCWDYVSQYQQGGSQYQQGGQQGYDQQQYGQQQQQGGYGGGY